MKINYNEIFRDAKESTVYAHAMVWIKEVVRNDKSYVLDRDKFNEIKEILFDAIVHLEEKEEEDE